jgi:succinate dehydrogenase / fumarate reductase cytochrome b subunit
VSILHRASGILMFLLLPFMVWMFDTSVSSEISFDRFTSACSPQAWALCRLVRQAGGAGADLGLPAPLSPALRHLWMDATTQRQQGFRAILPLMSVLAVSLRLTVVLGAKLFGLY